MAVEKFFIQTFGCQMNVADSERITAILAEGGLEPTHDPTEAAIVLINGCTIREKAVHKALSALGKLRPLKHPGQPPMIGVGGCVGQLDGRALFERAEGIDFVFGTDTIDELPEILHRVRQGQRKLVFTDFDASQTYSTTTKVYGRKAQAFVNIMKGCDKYCSYCIVPFTRGAEKSRRIDEVLADLSSMVAAGVREVTLLGQNVNSFGKGNPNQAQRAPLELHNRIGKVGPKSGDENFPQLLRAIDRHPGTQALQRIRFTSSHPLDFSDELITCYAPPAQGGVSRLAPHLHLPVQSGSDAILQKMGRHHRITDYQAQMQELRRLNPEVGLTTDLIVGFPTESDEDFAQTCRLLTEIEFDQIYAFAYSPRPGTLAQKRYGDPIPAEIKKNRLAHLFALQRTITARRLSLRIGRRMVVLIEGLAKRQKQPGKTWVGRTGCNCLVHFGQENDGDLTGQWREVEITEATDLSLRAELIAPKLRAVS